MKMEYVITTRNPEEFQGGDDLPGAKETGP